MELASLGSGLQGGSVPTPPAEATAAVAQREKVLRAGLVYAASLADQNVPPLRLHQSVSLAGISLREFLEGLPAARAAADATTGQLLDLINLQQLSSACVHGTVMAKKAKDLLSQYYQLPTGPDQGGPSSLPHLLWLLYLCGKHVLLPPGADLLHCYALMLACINLLLGSTPSAAPCLRAPFSSSSLFPCRTFRRAADTLQCVLAANNGREVQAVVIKLVQALDAFLSELTAPAGLHPASAEEAHGAMPANERPSPTCRVYLGLVSLQGKPNARVLSAAEAYYQQVVCPAVEVDERPFLQTAFSPFPAHPPAAPVDATNQLQGHPRALVQENLELGASQLSGNADVGLQQAAAWLELVAARHTQGSGLREVLEGALGSEAAAVEARLAALSAELVAAAWPAAAVGEDAAVSAQQRQAAALFYVSMQGLLSAEAARPGEGAPAVAQLLRSESFIRGVMVCSIESVAAAHRCLYKLVDAFIRVHPSLPPVLKLHLEHIEEAILESVGWKRGSSLFATISAAAGVRGTFPQVAAASGGASPGLGRLATIQEAAPALPASLGRDVAPGGDAHAHAIASGFVHKMVKLAAQRVQALSAQLDLGQATDPVKARSIVAQTVAALRRVAFHHTWLFYGRHLDHIALCSLYGMCRANHIATATFKAILTAYRAQPNTHINTFRSVRMAGREQSCWEVAEAPVSDIITFYNQVFLPAVKPDILHLAEQAAAMAAVPLAQPQHGPPALTPSPLRSPLSGVSPRAGSTFASPVAAHAPVPLKLSPGRWRMTPAGTQLLTPAGSGGTGAPYTSSPPALGKRKSVGPVEMRPLVLTGVEVEAAEEQAAAAALLAAAGGEGAHARRAQRVRTGSPGSQP